MSLFLKKAPKARIAGLHLAHTSATTLLQICQFLESTLETQTEDIRFLAHATETYLPVTLAEMQTRHETLTETLKNLSYSFQQHGLQEAWMGELSDALASMERKERWCWLESTGKAGMGWEKAAVLYWQLIAERYEVVFGVVAALERELGDALGNEMRWGRGARKRPGRRSLESVKAAFVVSTSGKSAKCKGKCVVFDERVEGCGFGAMEAPEEVGGVRKDGTLCEGGFTTKLARRGRSSTVEFRRRAVEKRRVSLLVGGNWEKENSIAWGENKGDEEEEGEDGEKKVGLVGEEAKEEIVEKVVDEPVERPVEEPVEGPVEGPVQEPVKEPTVPPRQERIRRAPRRRNLLF